MIIFTFLVQALCNIYQIWLGKVVCPLLSFKGVPTYKKYRWNVAVYSCYIQYGQKTISFGQKRLQEKNAQDFAK